MTCYDGRPNCCLQWARLLFARYASGKFLWNPIFILLIKGGIYSICSSYFKCFVACSNAPSVSLTFAGCAWGTGRPTAASTTSAVAIRRTRTSPTSQSTLRPGRRSRNISSISKGYVWLVCRIICFWFIREWGGTILLVHLTHNCTYSLNYE